MEDQESQDETKRTWVFVSSNENSSKSIQCLLIKPLAHFSTVPDQWLHGLGTSSAAGHVQQRDVVRYAHSSHGHQTRAHLSALGQTHVEVLQQCAREREQLLSR